MYTVCLDKCKLIEFEDDKVRVVTSLNRELWVRNCKVVDSNQRTICFLNGEDSSCVLPGTNRKLDRMPFAFSEG